MAKSKPQEVDIAHSEQLALDRYRLLTPYFENSCTMRELARDSGVPERTLWSWAKTFKEKGLTGFIRKQRTDRDIAKRVSPDIHKLIEALALRRPAPTVSYVHRQVRDLCSLKGWPVPSYSTVGRTVKRIDPAIRVLALEGTKAYKQKFDLIFRREAAKPNEIWQSDHTPLDIQLLDEQGMIGRPWLTVVLDDYSRAIAGYFLAFDSPAAWKTALALRQAIFRKDDPRWSVFGIPESFYTDHGSDFTSKRMEMVGASLKINLINSQVGEPRGRGKVERFFRTVNELFLCAIRGFAPAGHQPKGKLLTLDEFDYLFKEWLLSEYMTKKHSETGMAPQVRWDAHDFIPRFPDSTEQLDLLLCTEAQQRKVHRDGIRFYGLRYMDVNLCGYVGELVNVRFDPRDLAEIRLYCGDDFICRAVCQEIAGQVLSLKSIIKARKDERKRISNAIKESSAFLNEFIALHSSEPRHEDKKQEHPQTRLKCYRDD